MSENIRKMFGKISEKYDFMNTVLSFGVHHYWRWKSVRLSKIKKGMSVIDCASGTGDFAIAFRKKLNKQDKVVGSDFSADMLKYAKIKNEKHGYNIDFIIADALKLPFDSEMFDVASIAFGIRNVDSTVDCLKEMARIVKPGGKVIVLEFGQPKGLFSLLYKFYSRNIIPMVGNMILKDNHAYSYLNKSSEKYPCREKFIEIMNGTRCFSECSYHTFFFGIAFLYIGVVS
jgi:demethylmenaquinone methyltransferase / 2-methoxy-6-polyprenyl-1,4-benzoquinol methylase